MSRPEYKHFGYLMNFSLDLDFQYFEYLFSNDFDCILYVPENKNNLKKIDFVFFEDILRKYHNNIFDNFDFKQKDEEFQKFLRDKKINFFNMENKLSVELMNEIMLKIK